MGAVGASPPSPVGHAKPAAARNKQLFRMELYRHRRRLYSSLAAVDLDPIRNRGSPLLSFVREYVSHARDVLRGALAGRTSSALLFAFAGGDGLLEAIVPAPGFLSPRS